MDAADDLLITLPSGSPGAGRQLRISAGEFTWQFARSGGPGGQNVNKLATKALLRWNPARSALPIQARHRLMHLARTYVTSEGELLIVSQRHRTQLMNMNDCQEKLRQLIERALPEPVYRKATKPTRGSKERRLQDKKQQSHRRAQRRIRHDD